MPAAPPLAALARRLAPDPGTVPDADLLDRFARHGDPAAFELLVWRHGALVWGACRRVLAPDRHAAEDAAQAAFVALARHAGRVRDRGALAAWLHRVAVRAALDLRARRSFAPLPDDHRDPLPGPDRAASDREVRSLLDAGVNRLPERLRAAFVLCELEGRSNADAAAALGCPVGTVESRLVRARQRLRGWLSARGVMPVVGFAVVVPDAARAAMLRAAAPDIGPAVLAVANRAVRSALGVKLLAVAAAGLVMAVAAAGFGLANADTPQPPPPRPAAARQPGDAQGDPLPAGVIARLGSARLRHTGWVFDVTFSPDGKRIASVGTDADGLGLRVWDGDTGKQLVAVRRAEGGFDRVAFADGGRVIVAVGHAPGLACDLWRIDAATGEVTARVAPLPGKPSARPADPAVSFNKDGSRLAVGCRNDKRLHVFDTLAGAALWAAELGDEPGGAAFAPDGTVAVTTVGGKVLLFNAAGEPASVLSEPGVTNLTTVAFSPDGTKVLANGGGLVAWDRAAGKTLWKRQARAGQGIVFTPDGTSAICSESGFASCAIDPADGLSGGISGKVRPYFRSMVGATCSAVRPDGKAVAFGTTSGAVCLFDPVSGNPVSPTADPPHEVRRLRFSPDGRTLHGWAADWFAWDVATGTQRRVTNAGWCYGVPLSADGKLTAGSVWYSGARTAGSTDDGTRFEIRDAATGTVRHSHRGGAFPTNWYDFTPDGTAVVGGSPDGTLRVVAADTGRELARLPGHRAVSQYHAFSADGRVLVTGAFDDAEEFPVRVYHLKLGRELAKFHPGVRVANVAVSADGRRVAAVTATDSRGRPDPRQVTVVWDVATGKELARVPQFRESKAVALSPDGRLVGVGQSWHGEVRVWEVASQTERFRFRHRGPVTGLAFAPDGRSLAAASTEAPVYLWDVTGELAGPPAAWDAHAADRVWDDLASADAAKSFAAIRRLRGNVAAAVPFLRDRTKLPAAPGADALKALFTDLDAADFATREKAAAALAGSGEAIGDALRAELARSTSAETRKRLQGLVDKLSAPTPARLRLVRAVEAAEAMGTPAADALLAAWAGGSAGPTLAAEASAAVARRTR